MPAGGGPTADREVESGGITGSHRSPAFDIASLIRGRVAYWHSPAAVFGLAFNVSHSVGPDKSELCSDTELFLNGNPVSDGPELIARFDISVTHLAFDALFIRLPIAMSSDDPGGRLQPCVSSGSAVFSASMPHTALSSEEYSETVAVADVKTTVNRAEPRLAPRHPWALFRRMACGSGMPAGVIAARR